MKQRKSVISVAICVLFLFSSCTPYISRQDYVIDDSRTAKTNCDNIIVVKSFEYDPDIVDILGKISAEDPDFFTIKCSLFSVIESFKKDACLLGADIINITHESYPGYRGVGHYQNCYEAEAEFIKVKYKHMFNLNNIKTDPQYITESSSVSHRSSSYDECMNQAPAAGAIGGLVGILILFGMCKAQDAMENDD